MNPASDTVLVSDCVLLLTIINVNDPLEPCCAA